MVGEGDDDKSSVGADFFAYKREERLVSLVHTIEVPNRDCAR